MPLWEVTSHYSTSVLIMPLNEITFRAQCMVDVLWLCGFCTIFRSFISFIIVFIGDTFACAIVIDLAP